MSPSLSETWTICAYYDITSMVEDVSSKLSSLNKTLSTEETGMWLNARVNARMAVKRFFRREFGKTLHKNKITFHKINE